MKNMAIDVQNLHKSYGKLKVLKDISFSVCKGEIFALLGTNGAGKTTTLECLEGVRTYEDGNIKLEGKIGVQLQSSSLPKNIQALEAIHLFAKWNGSKVDNEYLSRLGIDEFKNRQYKDLSTGQKRRLHLVIALLGNPDIVFLDEPTAGLDVEGRVALHEEIKRIKAQEKTIIMASHDMAEVEELCDRIAILKDGCIAFLGTAQDLTSQYQNNYCIHIRLSAPFNKGEIKCSTYISEKQDYMVFETDNLADSLFELSSQAKKQSISINDIKVERDSLEQRFMSIATEARP